MTVFRATLWVLPTGFIVISVVGIEWLVDMIGFPSSIVVPVWLALGTAFTGGTGWFHSWLSGDAHIKPGGIRSRTLKFVLLQLLVVPGIVIGVILVCLAINPVHIPC